MTVSDVWKVDHEKLITRLSEIRRQDLSLLAIALLSDCLRKEILTSRLKPWDLHRLLKLALIYGKNDSDPWQIPPRASKDLASVLSDTGHMFEKLAYSANIRQKDNTHEGIRILRLISYQQHNYITSPVVKDFGRFHELLLGDYHSPEIKILLNTFFNAQVGLEAELFVRMSILLTSIAGSFDSNPDQAFFVFRKSQLFENFGAIPEEAINRFLSLISLPEVEYVAFLKENEDLNEPDKSNFEQSPILDTPLIQVKVQLNEEAPEDLHLTLSPQSLMKFAAGGAIKTLKKKNPQDFGNLLGHLIEGYVSKILSCTHLNFLTGAQLNTKLGVDRPGQQMTNCDFYVDGDCSPFLIEVKGNLIHGEIKVSQNSLTFSTRFKSDVIKAIKQLCTSARLINSLTKSERQSLQLKKISYAVIVTYEDIYFPTAEQLVAEMEEHGEELRLMAKDSLDLNNIIIVSLNAAEKLFCATMKNGNSMKIAVHHINQNLYSLPNTFKKGSTKIDERFHKVALEGLSSEHAINKLNAQPSKMFPWLSDGFHKMFRDAIATGKSA